MLNEKIKNIGEKELIKRIAKFMPINQTSDDCAFLATKKDNLLINTDLMVENTHFNHEIISPSDLGWKSVTTNYSDLISSGCIEFIGINIGLVLPPNTEWNWVQELYAGFSDALNIFGGAILGGDCSKGENIMISITAIGKQGQLKLRRSACKPREVLLTTGIHGLSKLGLLVKTNQINKTDFNLSQQLVDLSVHKFTKPRPKHEAVTKIIESKKNFKKNEIGCTDSSDGFYQAVLDLSKESKCKAIVDYQKIPKNKFWPKGKRWDQYYFFGGEDYELLISLPKEWANNLKKIDNEIFEIGYFIKGKPGIEIKNCPDNFSLENDSFSHF